MGILQIKKVERRGARFVFAFCGVSGSGKTYTALQFAWGLANGNAEKVGLLDTENGRGRLYSDILRDRKGDVHPFMHADLWAPFSPARYGQAIREFQEAGVEVLVIDSVTHEWEGLGGCHDIATAAGGGKTKRNGELVQNWAPAKMSHRADFMNLLLTCDMDIVCCVRAREKVEVSEGGRQIKSLGIQPVQEANFMFEMTASWMLHMQGKEQQVIKPPPDALKDHLCRGTGYITPADGLAVRKWRAEGGSVSVTTPEQAEAMRIEREADRMKAVLQSHADQGVAYCKKAWADLPKPIAKAIGEDWLQTLLASAQAFEDQAATAARAQALAGPDEEGDDSVEELNAMFAGGGDDDE